MRLDVLHARNVCRKCRGVLQNCVIAAAAMAAVSARRIVGAERGRDPSGLLEELQFVFSPTAFGTDREKDLAVAGCASEHIAQQSLLFGFCQHNPQEPRVRAHRILQLDRSSNLGRSRRGAIARLPAARFCASVRRASPTAEARCASRTAGDDWARFARLPVRCISRSPIPCGRI